MGGDRGPAVSASAVRASQEVRAVIGRLQRRIRAATGTEGISLPQASVLARLMDGDGLTTSDLAAAEGMRHQSMASTVAALAGLGLVERRRDPDDGRRLLIALTAEGRRRAEEGRQARGEWLAGELQTRCTEQERRTVIEAMAVLERLARD
ncbi:MarR family transcriptional regulator [Streptomyces cocklensis]|uniref:DNA-binding MarR family transcriptional regulator n=1 Tax=Actinacidiphila cocklensis TaxID=887465 RepID=A0A9W4E3Q4_9ACTN|nr:MarR family transcriptional regulator [Actinacidiphila cocklensis]MDD1057834.1 MarR family transcriptional regulator [Actinacidiphila cocklensis]CAG6398570.1 DNA-binding MarR family transcriptional regulator [Actinacidiphila cocklensis]